MAHGHAKSGRSSVIENVENVLSKSQGIRECLHRICDGFEGIAIISLDGRFCKAKSGKIRSDSTIAISQQWHQLAILKRRRRKPVKQKNHLAFGWTSFSIKDVYPICLNPMYGDLRRRA